MLHLCERIAALRGFLVTAEGAPALGNFAGTWPPRIIRQHGHASSRQTTSFRVFLVN